MELIIDDLKPPYPKSIFFIITTEFCERFSFYGMKTVLALFLNQVLLYSEDTSVILYHAFNALCYLTPILGAILADSFFGKFRTIFYISFIYAIGQIILTVGAIGNGAEGIPGLPTTAFAFLGLILIGIGTGGIKPCVASFGGEQFVLPDQQDEVKKFFSIFYAAINCGSLISTIITPIFRQNISCFGQDSCFPLAFGVPAVLMIVALHDIKSLLNVCVIFAPFPIFWALFDQQGSRWTFQATRMSGDVFGFQILPDQMQVINPILILIFIPFFDYVVYPLLAKIHLLKKPLQRIVVGGIIAGLSFGISGLVELSLEKTYPVLPKEGFGHLTVYNGVKDCEIPPVIIRSLESSRVEITEPIASESHAIFFLEKGKYTLESNFTACGMEISPVNFSVPPPPQDSEGHMKEDDAMTLLFSIDYDISKKRISPKPSKYRSRIDKSENGFPYVKLHWNLNDKDEGEIDSVLFKPKGFELEYFKTLKISLTNSTADDSPPVKVKVNGEYEIYLKKTSSKPVKIGDANLLYGANYNFFLQSKHKNAIEFFHHKITEENSLHMVFLLPQFIAMTAGEILFGITSLAFSFTQSPDSMKAVLMAVRFFTNALGNLFDVALISALEGVFASRAYEFFLFMGLMIIDMVWLTWLATRYKYNDKDEDKHDVVSICSVEDH